MRMREAVKLTSVILAALAVVAIVTQHSVSFSETQGESNIVQAYPIGTPTPTSPPLTPSPWPTVPPPTATPTPSAEAQIALRYVAEQYGIPEERWIIANEHHREYPELTRAFRAFNLFDPTSGTSVNLMVDLQDHTVVEDVAAIEQAEADARRAKYGKLEPALYERLQEAADDELVEVAIWIAGRQLRTQRERFAELAAMFPEARAALERSGKPFDVEDPEVRARIWRAYEQMLEADTQPLVQPLANHLRAQGYAVTTYDTLPSVVAVLPKHFILALAKRADVGRIFLAEGEGQLLLDSAVPTNRAPAVWQRGFDGTGSSIAIVETDNVDFTSDSQDCPAVTNNCFRNPGMIRTTNPYVVDYYHASLVASAAASDHPTHKGVAPGATIHSAGMTDGSKAELVEALKWSLTWDVSADVVNVSIGYKTGQDMDWTDWAFDYWARAYYRTIVVAAGNRDKCRLHVWDPLHLCSPAKAWNVISVGAYDDQNNSNWSDDAMWDQSSYIDPSSPNGDREKPEVVAPGVEIVGIGLDGNLVTDPVLNTGTSFVAPQVAGLAALLMDRDFSLRTWSEALRAIIMASAVHNIEGDSDIPSGEELRDGAGGIDAALADITAKTQGGGEASPCSEPCWWGITINDSSFPHNNELHRYFEAHQGERIRVAISWWSNADCPDENNCNFDRLDVDLHLDVYDPDNNWLKRSASWDNNYELVEFTAPKTGQYKIAVVKERFDEQNDNRLGIAWTKQATYLPDVKSNYIGWDSDIIIRNDSPVNQTMSVSLFWPWGGQRVGGIDDVPLPPNMSWTYDPEIYSGITDFWGYAVVNASESASVIVKNKHGDEVTAYNGILPEGSSGDPGWEQTGTVLYAPVIKKNHSGRSSDIYVVNVGSSTTNVQVTYYDGGGNIVSSDYYTNMQPGQTNLLNPFSPDTGPTLQSAVITSTAGQPLAALVMEYSDSDPNSKRSTHNVFRAGQPVIFAPLVKKDWGTPVQRTGLSIQNAGDNSTNIYVKYYNWVDGSLVKTLGPGYPDTPSCMYNLPPKATCVIYNPPGLDSDPNDEKESFLGSARAYSPTGQPLVGMVHENALDINRFMSHLMALANNSKSIFFPRQGKMWSEDGTKWTAAAMIMNIGDAETKVTVQLYWDDGTPYGSIGPVTLAAHQGFSTWPDMDDGFKGSALATSSSDPSDPSQPGEPIVAEVNYVNNGPSGTPTPSADTGSSFNGVNR